MVDTPVILSIHGKAAIVPLTRGLHAVIDIGDALLVFQSRWRAARCSQSRTWYVMTTVGSATPMLHRVILSLTDPSVVVDHVDGNGLNNRRANLKPTDTRGNSRNFHTVWGGSKYRGVHWIKRDQRWRATIDIGNRRTKYLGQYRTEEEAARAYDAALLALDPNAKTNFPNREAVPA